MSKASLELGGGNWAAKDRKLLGYAVGDTSGKYVPREFDFTRNSDIAATRVNEDGLIEKYRENLLLRSNQFDTTWTQVRADYTSGQNAYDGTSNAWKVECNTVGHSGGYQNTSSRNIVNCSSLYAKAGNVDYLFISTTQGSTNNCQFFNLSNGTLGSKLGSGIIDANIESVGNGWYRCSITMTPNASFGYFLFGLSDTDGNTTGAVGEYIYIQDAQLEAGLVATDYLESGSTTGKAGVLDNLPRIDYTGGSASLLLEPQRVNLIDYSEYYESYTVSNSSISSNATTSPEGLQNAAELIEDSSNNNHFFTISDLSYTSGTDVVFSIYLKENTRRYARLRFDNTGGNTRAWLDLRTGETTFIDATDSGVCTSVDVGNGWFRYEFKVTPSSTGTGSVQIFIQNVESVSGSFQTTYQGDGTSGIYVWGAQLEEGSYSTSYIPTYGVSATRNADKASLVGSDLLDQDNQTLFIEYTKGGIDGSANTIYSTSDGTSSDNRMQIVDNNDDVYLYSNAGGSNILNSIDALLLTNLEKGDTIKVAVVMTTTSIKAFANGVEKVNFTNSFSWSATMDDLYIGSRGNSSEFSKGQGVKQALLFPTALTDSECIALTTL